MKLPSVFILNRLEMKTCMCLFKISFSLESLHLFHHWEAYSLKAGSFQKRGFHHLVILLPGVVLQIFKLGSQPFSN